MHNFEITQQICINWCQLILDDSRSFQAGETGTNKIKHGRLGDGIRQESRTADYIYSEG